MQEALKGQASLSMTRAQVTCKSDAPAISPSQDACGESPFAHSMKELWHARWTVTSCDRDCPQQLPDRGLKPAGQPSGSNEGRGLGLDISHLKQQGCMRTAHRSAQPDS